MLNGSEMEMLKEECYVSTRRVSLNLQRIASSMTQNPDAIDC